MKPSVAFCIWVTFFSYKKMAYKKQNVFSEKEFLF